MKSILIVDDDAMLRTAMVHSFALAKFTVLEARDGQEAIDLLFKSAALPSIILTDGEMPRLNGPALITELRKIPALSRIPVVLYSGSFKMEEVARALRVPFFFKAGRPAMLRELIEETLNGV